MNKSFKKQSNYKTAASRNFFKSLQKVPLFICFILGSFIQVFHKIWNVIIALLSGSKRYLSIHTLCGQSFSQS